jgi:hypothetical protein
MQTSFHPLNRHLLRFTVALFVFLLGHYVTIFAQVKNYAASETHQTFFPCVLCSVQNPANAVGSNENDYSTLSITAGLLGGKVEQTLYFPAAVDSSFLVLGVGSSGGLLSLNLLGGVTVETFLGSVSNNDAKVIDSTALHLLSDTTKATVILFKTKAFDRVKITLKSLVGLLNNIRLYYAYNSTSIGPCGYIPPAPLAWYPFNGNSNDATPNGYNGTSSQCFFTDGVCNQAIASTDRTFGMETDNFPLLTGSQTVSVWIKDGKRSGDVVGTGVSVGIVSLNFEKRPSPIPSLCKVSLSRKKTDPFNPFPNIYMGAYEIDTAYMQLTVVYYASGFKHADLYINGQYVTGAPVGGQLNPVNYIAVFPQFVNVDDLIVYDRALNAEEIIALYRSYTRPNSLNQKQTANAPALKHTIETPAVQSLDFYPNPTTGTIQIKSKTDLSGGIITIYTMNGKEINRTVLQSNIIQIPASIPAGTYLIHLQKKEGKIHTGKVMLKK